MQESTKEEEERSLLSESLASNGECSDDAINRPEGRREIEETSVDDHESSFGRGEEERRPAWQESSREGTEPPVTSAPRYRLYRWRWLMLASLCLTNISNGTVREERGMEADNHLHVYFTTLLPIKSLFALTLRQNINSEAIRFSSYV